MRVAGNARYTFQAKIKELGLEPCFIEEGDKEGAEAAVHVQGDSALDGELGEERYVVYDAVREVGGGADEEDCVAVYEARDGGDVDLVAGGWAGDEVDFYAEVGAGFAECGVSCFGENPVVVSVKLGG